MNKSEKQAAIAMTVLHSAGLITDQLKRIPGNPSKKLFKARDRRRGKKKMRAEAMMKSVIYAALAASQIFIIQSQPIPKQIES